MVGSHKRDSTGPIPFWMHQLAELLLGLLLMLQGARTADHTALVVSLGGVLLLLALCSEGALGVWPWITRRLHRGLDVAIAAVLALCPLAVPLDGAVAILVLEAAALAMVWLAVRTDWVRKPRSGDDTSLRSPGHPDRTPR